MKLVKTPSTQAHAGERRPRRAVDLVEVGDAEGWDLLQGELQEPGLFGHDGGRRKPGPARDLGRRGELVRHRPLAGHHDLQHDLGVERLGKLATRGQRLDRMVVPRVAFANEVAGPERPEQVEPVVEVVAFRGGDAEPDLRHVLPGLAANGDLDRPVIAAGRRCDGRRAPLDGERRGLAQRLPGRERVGIGQRQRAVIGLVRRVGPVALILGLPGVGALEAAGEPDARRDLVAHGGDIEEGLQRHDQAGEFGLLHRAVAVDDGAGFPRHPLDRVQRDEARAVGPELGFGPKLDRENQAPLVLRHDVGAEGEQAVTGFDARVVADAKASVSLLDLQVGDLGRVGLPARAAHDEGDPAQRFRTPIADPAQLAGLKLGRKRAGSERPRRRRLLLSAVKLQRLCRCRRHVPVPAPA